MCASSKNNCIKNNLFQIQKTLVNIPIQAYNFKLKRIPSSFKHFYAEKQNVMFIILYHIIGLHFPYAIKQ